MSRAAVLSLACYVFSSGLLCAQTAAELVLPIAFRIENPAAVDQDDHCVWYNETKPDESRIVCSDKSANRVFVYDMRGGLKQTLTISKPGNIDCRNAVKVPSGGTVDVIVVNERDVRPALHVYVMDREKGVLIEQEEVILTGENYGGCLSYDQKDSALYAVITSKSGVIEQYHIEFEGGVAKGTKARSWMIGYCEGAVADDSTGDLFIAEEDGIIWKLGAAVESRTPGEALGRVGELGLVGNLEGMSLIRPSESQSNYVVVSDQGRNKYVVLTTTVPATKVLEFGIEQGTHTDGIEICQRNLGPQFPEGIMIVHTDNDKKQPIVVDLRELLKHLQK